MDGVLRRSTGAQAIEVEGVMQALGKEEMQINLQIGQIKNILESMASIK